MRQFVKYAAVGLCGYFIGFYEMKYKTVKTLLKVYAEKETKNEKENTETKDQ